MPQVELTRNVSDLDDDQFWEVLEALQTKTAQMVRWHPMWVTLGKSMGPWGDSDTKIDDWEVNPR